MISYKKKTFSLAVQIITDKKKKTFYSNDFPPVVGSDLHSKLKGGIRTSIDVPSSFSILKVLIKNLKFYDEENLPFDRIFLPPHMPTWC